MSTKETKLYILQKIEERKEILFGGFNDHLCKQDKIRCWMEIFEMGKACGAFDGKNWGYVRDVFWPNARKVTIVSIELFLFYDIYSRL